MKEMLNMRIHMKNFKKPLLLFYLCKMFARIDIIGNS